MSELNIYQRANALTAEGKALEKNGKMTGAGSYAFHKTDDVLAMLRPLLVKHGIFFGYSVEKHSIEGRDKTEDKYERQTVKCVKCVLVNVDNPCDMIEGLEYGYGIDPSDKGAGKATSYAIKTWLLNTFKLRGQPDENTLQAFDDVISQEKADEIREMVNSTGSDELKLLKAAKVKAIEKIPLSKVAIIEKLLKERQ